MLFDLLHIVDFKSNCIVEIFCHLSGLVWEVGGRESDDPVLLWSCDVYFLLPTLLFSGGDVACRLVYDGYDDAVVAFLEVDLIFFAFWLQEHICIDGSDDCRVLDPFGEVDRVVRGLAFVFVVVLEGLG